MTGPRPLRPPRPVARCRYLPAAAGVAGIVATVVGADVWAARTRRPTISAAVADCLDHQVLAPVVVGVLAGLGWHLAIDPIVRRVTGP